MAHRLRRRKRANFLTFRAVGGAARSDVVSSRRFTLHFPLMLVIRPSDGLSGQTHQAPAALGHDDYRLRSLNQGDPREVADLNKVSATSFGVYGERTPSDVDGVLSATRSPGYLHRTLIIGHRWHQSLEQSWTFITSASKNREATWNSTTNSKSMADT